MSKKPAARATAQEFYSNIIALGKMAKEHYLDETRRGLRAPNFTELRELEMNIETCEKELAKHS